MNPPAPPAELSAEASEAWWRGYRDGQIAGPESRNAITPHHVGEQAELFKAWLEGMDAAQAEARAKR